MTGTTARSQDCINNNDNGGIIIMKNENMILEAVKMVKETNRGEAVNIEFMDSYNTSFFYGIVICNILDRDILACGVWGASGYTYIDIDDYQSSEDDEDLASAIKSDMKTKYGAVEIISVEYNEE